MLYAFIARSISERASSHTWYPKPREPEWMVAAQSHTPHSHMSKIACTVQPSLVSWICRPWKVMALISVYTARRLESIGSPRTVAVRAKPGLIVFEGAHLEGAVEDVVDGVAVVKLGQPSHHERLPGWGRPSGTN